ncbi:hypothetical protein LZL87_000916 [Fusarium oxysporum]|nr:hypothetical protein LZL87_000916 [Fusarium oxysporum]
MAVVIVLVGTVELSVPREVTVVVTTLHTRAVVGVVELEMKDPDPIKVLVVLLTHHLGLVVRMARAFMPPEDMIAIAENKGMKFMQTMTIRNSDNIKVMEMVMVVNDMDRTAPVIAATVMGLWPNNLVPGNKKSL